MPRFDPTRFHEGSVFWNGRQMHIFTNKTENLFGQIDFREIRCKEEGPN